MSRVLFAALLVVVGVLPARAELVFFTSGGTLSVRGHRAQGDMLVLLLRDGGEFVCEAALVERVGPDEVPYPEPAVSPASPGLQATATLPRTPLPTNREYDPIIRKVSSVEGVDPELVRAVIQVESAYQPLARSPKGAVGLMQLMPETARQYGVRNPYDPAANIQAGIRHLKSLLNHYPLALALAAYNAGSSAVERYGGIPPYRETEDYVSRVLALVGG